MQRIDLASHFQREEDNEGNKRVHGPNNQSHSLPLRDAAILRDIAGTLASQISVALSQEKEKVKERSVQIEEKRLPFVLLHPFFLTVKARTYIYTSKQRSRAKKREGERQKDRGRREERIGGFTFLIYRLRCQRSPSSRQYLENLKGAARA